MPGAACRAIDLAGDEMTAPPDAQGVFTICPTPFDDGLRVDTDSIRGLVDFLLETGIAGLAVLGFLGELHKLSAVERRLVARTFVEQAAGRVPVWVGVRGLGIAGAIEQAQEAQELGAAAVLRGPAGPCQRRAAVRLLQGGGRGCRHPRRHPRFSGFLRHGDPARSRRAAGAGRQCACHQDGRAARGPEITRIRELCGDAPMKIFGGLGGVYFLEELQRGAVGIDDRLRLSGDPGRHP